MKNIMFDVKNVIDIGTWKVFFRKMLIILLLVIIIFLIYVIFFTKPRSVNLRTRDVARKVDLSHIREAITMFYEKNGEWPQISQAINGMSVRGIEVELLDAGMSYVPGDPVQTSVVSGLGDKFITGDYVYMVSVKDGILNGGFILMSKMENDIVPNWVVCDNGEGVINSGIDLVEIKLCSEISKGKICSNLSGVCTYTSSDQLRYVLIY